MKKIAEFFNSEIESLKKEREQQISEGRPAGSKNKPKGDNVNPEEIKGESAEDNGTEGAWGIEEPTEDDLLHGVDKETLNKNKKRILMRLKSKKPFFVQGEAGWGKTSLITKLAHQCGRTVITVYLDKCEATDLSGIPVPAKSKRGADYVKNLMPGWAKIMYDNPNTQYLLFFDEMNQAAPDVMNALMPIVLKNVVCGVTFKNFIVGAAGNFEEENEGGVNELSKPLLSRFGGVITWQSGDWDNAFGYMHKKWDGKVGKELIDKLKENADLFRNPRDVENHIIEKLHNLKEDGDVDLWDASDYLDELNDLAIDADQRTRSQSANLEKLADYIYAFMNGKIGDNSSARKRGNDQVNEDIRAAIKKGMESGYIPQEETDENGNKVEVRYGISRENIVEVFTDEGDINAEMCERIISKFENEGVKFKYQKDKEWQDANLKDPMQLKINKDFCKDLVAYLEKSTKKNTPKKNYDKE